jgi:hypothetical protein
LAILELRRKRLTHARIPAALDVSKSTVSRVLARPRTRWAAVTAKSAEPWAAVKNVPHTPTGASATPLSINKGRTHARSFAI